MRWFRKHHTCPCGEDWWDEWDYLCNDRCPRCDAEIFVRVADLADWRCTPGKRR